MITPSLEINWDELEFENDPFLFSKMCWPDLTFYKQQEEIIYSVMNYDETIVPAANMMGKDFVAGFIVIWYFVTHTPCRIITTSVKDDHLRVLWGEINRFIQSSVVPLDEEKGGPIIVRHHEMNKKVGGEKCGISYCRGCVSLRGEGMAGHHAAYTLLVMDEASGIENVVYTQGDTWAKKKFIFGNPNPCTNFFYTSVREGDVKEEKTEKIIRKVIQIKADHSPNVILGKKLEQDGHPDPDQRIIPGILSYGEYKKRRVLWDLIRQSIGLDAEFYEGAEILLFPPDWLNSAEEWARVVTAERIRVGSERRVMGVDTAEGGDSSCWCIVDMYGLIELLSMKTPDTSVIPGQTLALMRRYNIDPEDILFDRGGGGKEHADRLRRNGYEVRTIAFGEAATTIDVGSERTRRFGFERLEDKETRYIYKNRRAEMYGELRRLLDPTYPGERFGIPDHYTELRRQLSPIPLMYDAEGRLVLPPKNQPNERSSTPSLVELIGCSPDEADSLALAVHGLLHPANEHQIEVGGLW